MLVEAARRVETAAKEALALVNDGSASCEELRAAVAVLRSASGIVAAAQTSAAASVAGRERQGDGGVEVLASAGGLSRREARSQVKTAETLQQVPEVRSAVESGRVTQANATQLAAAVQRAGAQAVASDGSLLESAESMRPDEFKREARRWCAQHDADRGASEHQRQRARRYLRISDTDDGMVCLHGEFDAVAGRQIENRLRAVAKQMQAADKHNAESGGTARSFKQCMADALHHLSAAAQVGDGGGRGFADICVVAHVDDDTAELVGALPDGSKLPASVLDTLTANARLTGLIYDRCGKPIWRTESARNATRSQRQILNAKWGGCFHCGAHFAICQPHHIEPVSRGGPTRIDNLVPACWECHDLIHEHRWWILKRKDGNHTLHPPEPLHHGPAHAPDQQVYFRTEADLNEADRARTEATATAPSHTDTRAAPRRHAPPARAAPATASARAQEPIPPGSATRTEPTADTATTPMTPRVPRPEAKPGKPAAHRPRLAPTEATLLDHGADPTLEAARRASAETRQPDLPEPVSEAQAATARAAITAARAALSEARAQDVTVQRR